MKKDSDVIRSNYGELSLGHARSDSPRRNPAGKHKTGYWYRTVINQSQDVNVNIHILVWREALVRRNFGSSLVLPDKWLSYRFWQKNSRWFSSFGEFSLKDIVRSVRRCSLARKSCSISLRWLTRKLQTMAPESQRLDSPRQNTIGSLADRALQSKQQADVKLAQAVANAHEAGWKFQYIHPRNLT